jgi:uncharacterized membrane protein YesL
VRAAIEDFYFNSWRLVPANLLWSATLIAVLAASLVSPLAALALPIVALPTAGLFRMSALIARGAEVSFGDAIGAWRTYGGPSVLLGGALAAVGAVLGVNLVTGVASGSVVGWSLATLAFWGLVATWVLGWAAWPLLVDPARSEQPVRARLRIAVTVALARPSLMLTLGILLAVVLVVSTIAVAALATVSMAFAALVATRTVLPVADRIDGLQLDLA